MTHNELMVGNIISYKGAPARITRISEHLADLETVHRKYVKDVSLKRIYPLPINIAFLNKFLKPDEQKRQLLKYAGVHHAWFISQFDSILHTEDFDDGTTFTFNSISQDNKVKFVHELQNHQNHKLHKDPFHDLMKEAGELLSLYI